MLHNVLSQATKCDTGLISTAIEVIDGLPWPAILLDEDGTVVHVNERLSLIPGLEAAPVGHLLSDVFPEFSAVLDGDIPWLTPQDTFVSLRRGDQGERHLRLHVRRLSCGSYLLLEDETETRELELHFAQTSRLASLGFMLAGVCHEVSNPLAATYSMVQIMQSRLDTSDEMLRKGLDNIASNVRRILEVSSRISEFSRVLDEEQAFFDVNLAVDEALAMLGQGASLSRISVKRRTDLGTVVFGRASELRQVFFNILLNGVQALNGSGHLIIDARCVPPAQGQEGEGTVVVTIRDTGPGIAERDLERIFEPFFTTKGCREGTGLGLAISYEIVQEHEGDLTVENHPQGGACFTIRLPLRKAQA